MSRPQQDEQGFRFVDEKVKSHQKSARRFPLFLFLFFDLYILHPFIQEEFTSATRGSCGLPLWAHPAGAGWGSRSLEAKPGTPALPAPDRLL